MKYRRGFLFIDAIVALGLLTSVAMLLVVARSGLTKATRQADDRRAAVRIAERYLVEAALAKSPPATQPVADVRVNELSTAAPAGWKWVTVRATVNGRSSELTGLIRRRS